MFALRDYQRQCLEAIEKAYWKGVRRQLVCLPTGAGKTVVFAHLPQHLRMKKRMLVLAHREELLDQAVDKFRRANPDLRVGVEQAERRADDEDQVVVASVQTLGREGSGRLDRFAAEAFSIVVVDEAHHAVADSYRRVLAHFGLFAPQTKKLLVGVTATPRRGDDRGLDEVFQEIVYRKTIREMIESKVLCGVAGWRVETETSLDGVATRLGDFVPGQLADRVNVPARNRLVVAAYREELQGRRTLAFCVDVQHAIDLASEFRAAGVACLPVWGDMPRDRRVDALAAFSRGDVKVLTNCNVLTEGYDEPLVEGILLAKPTKSALLYAQMVGRGLRTAPGKGGLTVIDVVDNTRKHDLASLPTLFGLPEKFDLEGKDVLETAKELERIRVRHPYLKFGEAHTVEDVRALLKKIDLLSTEVPEELAYMTDLAWIPMPDGSYRLCLAGKEHISIAENLLGQMEVERRDVEASGRPVRSRLALVRTLEKAVHAADAWVREERGKQIGLLNRFTRWRREPATPKQVSLLESLGQAVKPGLSKGEAAMLITQTFARKGMRGP